MADTQELDWDSINVDEDVTEEDQAASEDISMDKPVGKFLVTVVETKAIEKSFTDANKVKGICAAANLKMRIDAVLEIEKPILDDKGQPLKRSSEVVKKRQPVEGEERTKAEALHVGRFFFDEVNLYHKREKEAFKKRRLFIGKKVGLITKSSAKMTGKMWGKDIIGKQAVVTTEWNHWEDPLTKEPRKNVKVAWSGYDFAELAGAPEEDDFSSI